MLGTEDGRQTAVKRKLTQSVLLLIFYTHQCGTISNSST